MSRPRLLLVHGWGADRQSWNEITKLVTPWADVLAPDLLGHGSRPSAGSRTSAGSLTVSVLVDDLAAGVTEPVVAVGHSMGGQLVAWLAVRYPALVERIVVIDPAYGADDAEMERCPAVLEDLRTRGADSGVEFVDRAFADAPGSPLHLDARAQMAATPGEVLAELYESMYLAPGSIGARPAARAFLPSVGKPCLSLYSGDYAAAFARSIPWAPGSKIEVWPGATHYLHQQHPERFADLLRSWL
ncbi:alpha/beta fold hydrolase [Kribbella sp. NPDC050124]|uniref:alpha/beta fold hydrolase n=1 Tax=Kribbella sp. NPDC050124 TaxID=3364114 RepID=UPI003792CBD2